jgi:hypothetical protein
MDSGRRGVARAVPWAAVLLPPAELLLVVTGLLPVDVAVLVAVVLEVAFVAVLVAKWTAFRRAWRAERARGVRAGQALLAGVEAALPRPVAFVLRSEVGMAQSLWWAVRRRRLVRPGETPIPYTDRIGVMLWTTVGLSVLEVGAAHLLVPWPAVRWVLLGVGAYGLLWLVAFAFSVKQRPHTLGRDALTLRFGYFREVVVPVAGITAVTARVELGHKRNLASLDGRLSLSVMGETSVEVRLHPGTTVTLDGRPRDAERVVFFADDPRAVVRQLRARQAAVG